jgi:hypothetical protein
VLLIARTPSSPLTISTTGLLQAGNRHGEGVLRFSDGMSFDGKFDNGRPLQVTSSPPSLMRVGLCLPLQSRAQTMLLLLEWW